MKKFKRIVKLMWKWFRTYIWLVEDEEMKRIRYENPAP